MYPQIWSYVLATVGVTGLFLTGCQAPALRRAGWTIGLASQTLWAAYAISTHQYGFLVTCALYGASHGSCLWRNRARKESPARATDTVTAQ